ncbi:PhzF family phenazine biosynthesis protein [Rhodoferax sp.]|uniref:PhzF family phenazine biosynthesis protein n=1 Tax=Rhodoferax sp. TaxID=50421 RepID=UPI0027195413|nr:PhzF family phenazine biosynthesis protein [Rhodoferax sp.]MDO9195088.1 PhzF family phenazine biosynthesis protein [Rhodoferax sp.]
MKTRPFKQVDVFTAEPYLGNPLAVVLDGTGLSDFDMQHFAHWTNLSETTFVLPPSAQGAAAGADYRVRIFTPGAELPFAGHPTLGSCHAWLEAGGAPKAKDEIVQECQVGLVRIRRDGTRLAFAAPPLKRSNPSPALLAKVAAALGLKAHQIVAAQLLDNGPVWLGLLLDSPQTVLQLAPNHLELKNLRQKVGVAGMEPAQPATTLIARSNREARAFGPRAIEPAAPSVGATELEVRAFAAPVGINEDPVTGSFNASLAQWLIADGFAPSRYVATQGTCLGRNGQVHVACDATGQVWVGGDSVTCIDGSVAL